MAKLTLQLQGPIQIKLNDQVLEDLGTTKTRGLLVYLALEGAKTHSRDHLAALFWPSQSEKHAKQSLRQALFQLKKVINGVPVLDVSNRTIRLDPGLVIQSDTAEIEALASACREHGHRGIDYCLPCLQRQQAILDLFQGEFLDGFQLADNAYFNEWLILRREKIHLIAMAANDILGKYYERRGEYHQSLQYVQAQLALEPWREISHRQAIRLYALLGERSRALNQYQECCAVLKKEFDVSPTAATERLVDQIKTGSLQAISPTINIIPIQQRLFVGREDDLNSLVNSICEGRDRLLTILGVGGVGKSALVEKLSNEMSGLFRDGIFRVQLRESDNLLASLADSLGIESRVTQKGVLEHLLDKDMLLILDNFDKPFFPREFVGKLFANCRNLQIVLTTRETLNLRGEKVFYLKGLSYPERVNEQNWQSFDSLVLLVMRIRRINPEYRVTEANLNILRDLAERVEGLPLALEFLANLLASGEEAALKKVLSGSLEPLQAPFADMLDKHHSMAMIMEQSWHKLSTIEKDALSRLSVFKGGFTLEAAAAVADVQAGMIDGLIDKSMITPEEQGRYRINTILRSYLQRKWQPGPDISKRHALFYSSLPKYSLSTPSMSLLQQIKIEKLNLSLAWKWALEEDEFDILQGLIANILAISILRGPLTYGEKCFTQALEAIERKGHPQILNELSFALSKIYLLQMRFDEMMVLMQALPETARSQFVIGQALNAKGECATAKQWLEKALLLNQNLDDPYLEMDCLRELGNSEYRLVDYPAAQKYYGRCLDLANRVGDLRNQSAVLNNWASVNWDLGELDLAEERYRKALKVYRKLGNRVGEAKALNNLSNVIADLGDLQKSLEYSHAALAIHKDMGNIRGQSGVLNNLGVTYFVLKQYDAAREIYEKALALYELMDNRQAMAETLGNLSFLDFRQGCFVKAREKAQRAMALAESTGDKVGLSTAMYFLGRIDVAEGYLNQAAEVFDGALKLRESSPHPGHILELEAELMNIAFQRREYDKAKCLLDYALDKMGSLQSTNDPERVEALVERIKSQF
jgi:DNA-binding SARP family transcriptional activator/predicted ATPase/Tfp pilus assembly protein PilF